MKVTFIQPQSVFLLGDKTCPPLGILFLSSWLRKHGHEVSIIDLADHGNDWQGHLKKESKKLDGASYVGMTCTTPQYYDSMKISDYIRNSMGYDIPMVCGGIHLTSIAYRNEMDFIQTDSKYFDSFVIGEGFNAVTKMCNDIESSGKLKQMYAEPILKDVNDLPFAARDLIGIKDYKFKLGNVNSTTHYGQFGCIYNCSYCESPLSGTFTVRAMNPKRVVDEAKQVRDDFGIYGAMWFDDELNLDMKRVMGICELLKKEGDISWRGFVVTAKWNDDIARACKESGCYEIASGIESGSPAILKNIHKPATVDINRRFIISAKKAGLRVKAFLIIGLPGESWRTVYETFKFLQDLKSEGYAPDDIDTSILQVYKGAPIYKTPLDIEFEMDYDKSYYKSTPGVYESLVQVKTKEMSKYDLVAARNFLEYKFKKKNWLEDYTGRKDLDRIYEENDSIRESIQFAEKQLKLI